ncbi:ATP-binding protein [Mangrovibacterium marinum]|uniref:histidine kinase n=1 Tax=Mangrovibacterium marinum TaxID=1639118 RepID=A0A2T5C5H9_9BACT|nr:ATP-binding protein [Mangrovibacterium marinum]PTN10142.1 signal transduction histidine kinase [Mangrovibacterium marinum]
MLFNSTEIDFLIQTYSDVGIGIWHVRMPDRRFFINKTIADILEQPWNEEAVSPGTNWMELKPQDGFEWITPLIGQLSTNYNWYAQTLQINSRGGRPLNVQINGRISALDEHNSPAQITGTFFDRSALEQTNQSLNYRYEIEKLVSGISSDFMESRFENLDATINQSLEKIGNFCQIDRSYLFQIHPELEMMDNTHEWCAPGISPEIENLQGLPCSTLPWWMNQLNNKKHIYIYDVAQMPPEANTEKEILEAQQIKSLLVVPMLNKKGLMGFLGFDSVSNYKTWSNSDIQLLQTVANIMGNALTAQHDHQLLIIAKQRAEESDRQKSAFLATMNHELRTPLHHILGFSDLIVHKKMDMQQVHRFARKISESGNYLLRIVEDIISLSVGRKSDVKVREDFISGLDLLIQHKAFMNELTANSSRSKKIRIVLSPDSDFQEQCFIADKHKINQIFFNLFKNALKFTKKGTIEYKISLKDNRLSISIKDEGIGIRDDQKELIFDFFRQGDEGPSRHFQGIGIGLAICKHLVQVLHGSLTLSSEPRRGSTFRVSIPVARASQQSLADDNQPKASLPDFSNYRFLLIDNDPNSLFLHKNLLAATQANIITSGTDMDVLSLMGEHCFLDIILINLNTEPEENIRLIRQMTKLCCKCSIIGLTAHSLLDQREKALEAGCVDVLSIPVDAQLLFEAIRKGLKTRQCSK